LKFSSALNGMNGFNFGCFLLIFKNNKYQIYNDNVKLDKKNGIEKKMKNILMARWSHFFFFRRPKMVLQFTN